MDIRLMSKKLRAAADALDDLLAGPGTVQAARAIAEGVRRYKPNPMKGRTYKKGTHWTQRPENRARVAALARKAHNARRKAA